MIHFNLVPTAKHLKKPELTNPNKDMSVVTLKMVIKLGLTYGF